MQCNVFNLFTCCQDNRSKKTSLNFEKAEKNKDKIKEDKTKNYKYTIEQMFFNDSSSNSSSDEENKYEPKPQKPKPLSVIMEKSMSKELSSSISM